jgi:hypothetical protein
MSASAAIADPPLVVREAWGGMSVSVLSYASYEIRFTRNAHSGDFATNRHE